MRLHRFYINQSLGESVVSIKDDDLVHQWKKVFRYIVGTQVIVFNGDGYDYLCFISDITNKTVLLNITSRKKSLLPKHNISIAFSLIKKDNAEMVIQKAVELGVKDIFPIISERSEKKSINIERCKKIIKEASEQCGRGDIPNIYEPVELGVFLETEIVNSFDVKIVFHPKSEEYSLSDIGEKTLFFVGPEGGFSDKEIEKFREFGIGRRSFGEFVLRAETATIAVLGSVLCL